MNIKWLSLVPGEVNLRQKKKRFQLEMHENCIIYGRHSDEGNVCKDEGSQALEWPFH